MNKGLVMEVQGKSIIVMTPSGTFERIPARNRKCQVGEEIIYASRPTRHRQPAFAAMSVFVAAVVFCMMLFTGVPAIFADKSVVAYVSMDINPSVEIGIDKREKVRELRGLNEKGLEIARDISYSGKSLEEVADKVLQKAEDMEIFKSGEADIIIASTLVDEDKGVNDQLVTDHLKQQVMAHVITKHPDQVEKIVVTAFTAPAEVREVAVETGLSLGKYSVYLNAKSEGHDVKVEDLKQESIHNIAKEAGGLSKLVNSVKLEKESIKELLKEEKDGSLDKKVKEKSTDAKSSTKPSTKSSSTPKPTSPSPTPKQATPSPSNKASVKPGEASQTPDAKKDNKNQEDKAVKDDKAVKNNGSSSSPSNDTKESDKAKNEKSQDEVKTDKVDEDRKTSGPSADPESKSPKEDKASNDNKEDAKK